MERYSLQEAQARLAELMAEALEGKIILIVSEDGTMVQLAPVTSLLKSDLFQAVTPGGHIKISADFDALLADFDDYSF